MKQLVVDFKKYLSFTKIAKINKKIYVMDLLNDVCFLPIKFLFLTMIWFAIYSALDLSILNGYSKWEIITYYFIFSVVNYLSRYYKQLPYQVWKEINNGNLSKYLCRPIKYLNYQFFYGLGYAYYSVFLCIPIVLIVWFVFFGSIRNIITLIIFGISTILGTVIIFYVYILIGFITFWTESIFGYRDLILHIGAFFSGAILPLNFFPNTLVNLSCFFPFRYMLYDPISIYMGNTLLSDSIVIIIKQLIYIVVLLFFTNFIWRRGIKRYEAMGG